MITTGPAAFLRQYYRDVSRSLSWDTASTSSAGDGAIPCPDGFTIFVQRIGVLIETSAAQTMTFRSELTTVTVGYVASAPTTGSLVVADWGDEGKALPQGEDLDIVVSGAGLGAEIKIDAYLRQTAPRVPSEL